MSRPNSRNSPYLPSLQLGGSVTLDKDATYNLGSPAARFNTIYGVNVVSSASSEPYMNLDELDFPYSGAPDSRFHHTATNTVTFEPQGGNPSAHLIITGDLNTSVSTTTPITTTDSVVFNRASHDTRLLRSGANTLTLDDNAGGGATFITGVLTATNSVSTPSITSSTTGVNINALDLTNVNTLQSNGGYFNTAAGGSTYTTGTVSQSGTALTGSGTTFTSSMVGGMLYITGGLARQIAAFVDTTHLTMFDSKTYSSTAYTIYYGNAGISTGGGITSANLINTGTVTTTGLTTATGGVKFGVSGTPASYVPSTLSNFQITGSTSVTWTGPYTTGLTTGLYFQLIGKLVIMTMQSSFGVATATAPIDATGTPIPLPFRPTIGNDFRFLMQVRDAADEAGNILIQSSGAIRVSTGYVTGGSFTSGSTQAGWVGGQTFMWLLA